MGPNGFGVVVFEGLDFTSQSVIRASTVLSDGCEKLVCPSCLRVFQHQSLHGRASQQSCVLLAFVTS